MEDLEQRFSSFYEIAKQHASHNNEVTKQETTVAASGLIRALCNGIVRHGDADAASIGHRLSSIFATKAKFTPLLGVIVDGRQLISALSDMVAPLSRLLVANSSGAHDTSGSSSAAALDALLGLLAVESAYNAYCAAAPATAARAKHLPSSAFDVQGLCRLACDARADEGTRERLVGQLLPQLWALSGQARRLSLRTIAALATDATGFSALYAACHDGHGTVGHPGSLSAVSAAGPAGVWSPGVPQGLEPDRTVAIADVCARLHAIRASVSYSTRSDPRDVYLTTHHTMLDHGRTVSVQPRTQALGWQWEEHTPLALALLSGFTQGAALVSSHTLDPMIHPPEVSGATTGAPFSVQALLTQQGAVRPESGVVASLPSGAWMLPLLAATDSFHTPLSSSRRSSGTQGPNSTGSGSGNTAAPPAPYHAQAGYVHESGSGTSAPWALVRDSEDHRSAGASPAPAAGSGGPWQGPWPAAPHADGPGGELLERDSAWLDVAVAAVEHAAAAIRTGPSSDDAQAALASQLCSLLWPLVARPTLRSLESITSLVPALAPDLTQVAPSGTSGAHGTSTAQTDGMHSSAPASIQTALASAWSTVLLPCITGLIRGLGPQPSASQHDQALIDLLREGAAAWYDSGHGHGHGHGSHGQRGPNAGPSAQPKHHTGQADATAKLGLAFAEALAEGLLHGYGDADRLPELCARVLRAHAAEGSASWAARYLFRPHAVQTGLVSSAVVAMIVRTVVLAAGLGTEEGLWGMSGDPCGPGQDSAGHTATPGAGAAGDKSPWLAQLLLELSTQPLNPAVQALLMHLCTSEGFGRRLSAGDAPVDTPHPSAGAVQVAGPGPALALWTAITACTRAMTTAAPTACGTSVGCMKALLRLCRELALVPWMTVPSDSANAATRAQAMQRAQAAGPLAALTDLAITAVTMAVDVLSGRSVAPRDSDEAGEVVLLAAAAADAALAKAQDSMTDEDEGDSVGTGVGAGQGHGRQYRLRSPHRLALPPVLVAQAVAVASGHGSAPLRASLARVCPEVFCVDVEPDVRAASLRYMAAGFASVSGAGQGQAGTLRGLTTPVPAVPVDVDGNGQDGDARVARTAPPPRTSASSAATLDAIAYTLLLLRCIPFPTAGDRLCEDPDWPLLHALALGGQVVGVGSGAFVSPTSSSTAPSAGEIAAQLVAACDRLSSSVCEGVSIARPATTTLAFAAQEYRAQLGTFGSTPLGTAVTSAVASAALMSGVIDSTGAAALMARPSLGAPGIDIQLSYGTLLRLGALPLAVACGDALTGNSLLPEGIRAGLLHAVLARLAQAVQATRQGDAQDNVDPGVAHAVNMLTRRLGHDDVLAWLGYSGGGGSSGPDAPAGGRGAGGVSRVVTVLRRACPEFGRLVSGALARSAEQQYQYAYGPVGQAVPPIAGSTSAAGQRPVTIGMGTPVALPSVPSAVATAAAAVATAGATLSSSMATGLATTVAAARGYTRVAHRPGVQYQSVAQTDPADANTGPDDVDVGELDEGGQVSNPLLSVGRPELAGARPQMTGTAGKGIDRNPTPRQAEVVLPVAGRAVDVHSTGGAVSSRHTVPQALPVRGQPVQLSVTAPAPVLLQGYQRPVGGAVPSAPQPSPMRVAALEAEGHASTAGSTGAHESATAAGPVYVPDLLTLPVIPRGGLTTVPERAGFEPTALAAGGAGAEATATPGRGGAVLVPSS